MMDKHARELVAATQAGLPVTPTPYADAAAQLGIDEHALLATFRQWQQQGLLRRVALVPNHYRLGYRYNAMTVWDIDDAQVDTIGERFAALPWVSHCYRRPRMAPHWPYNLFAMVHSRCADTIQSRIDTLAELAAADCRRHEVLYSRRILKKTGLRLSHKGD